MWKLDNLQEHIADVGNVNFNVGDSSGDTKLYTDDDGCLSRIESLNA